jgi:hypothetical protein
LTKNVRELLMIYALFLSLFTPLTLIPLTLPTSLALFLGGVNARKMQIRIDAKVFEISR